MRRAALLLLAGCGGATVTAAGSATLAVSSSVDEAPTQPAPADVLDEHHAQQHVNETPTHAQDVDKLYVEVSSDGEHNGDVLRQTTTTALGSIPYAVATEEGADVELHVELASLTPGECKVKIFIMRLPQHDLLAIADGAAQRTGHTADDQCLSMVDDAIVRTKLPPFLQKRLADKK